MDILIEIVGKPFVSVTGPFFFLLLIASFCMLYVLFFGGVLVGVASFVFNKIKNKTIQKVIKNEMIQDLLIILYGIIAFCSFVASCYYWDKLDETNEENYKNIYHNIISNPKIDSLSKIEKEILNRCLLPRSNYPSLLAIQSCVDDEIEKEKIKEEKRKMKEIKPIQ
ncbi:hypothetical protein B0187_01020 [Haemophilus paracuniculus]|uniref:Uncharacterized protein n=1 Tax=Haemophilus paracuniculus TaxID=734 RepID=A0A1T0AVN6_9PAST|nr:hypothetical protein [Haemophilus paracuniculus]OOS00905.1 hypothetical protein B0187_01020 [Haemophilus paracuniculus]